MMAYERASCAGDPIGRFGGEPARRLRELIAAGVRQGRFDRAPIGPLGSLLALADDRYGTAVEIAIGRSFYNYLVHSHKDLKLLQARPSS